MPQGLIDNRPIFFMPRVNFAWDISGTGDTVLRGGGGLFYNRRWATRSTTSSASRPTSYVTSSTPTPVPEPRTGQGLTYNTIGMVDPLEPDRPHRRDRLDQPGLDSTSRACTTSLSLARRIPWQQMLEVGYVGTFGRNL